MTIAHNLGFPRIGHQRELKKALEAYWSGAASAESLLETGRQLRAKHWKIQQEAGIDLIPVGDFAYYDQMLNMTALLGAVPARFEASGDQVDLDTYFAMARGNSSQPAMEMTKWFDTNYHYIVPEFSRDAAFRIASNQLFREVEEAKALGLKPKPVLIGPITYLYLGKEKGADFDRLSLLPQLVQAYQLILGLLKDQGVEWVQLDEPALALDLSSDWISALDKAYASLTVDAPKILLATYFESVEALAPALKSLPVAGLHIDLVRAPQQLPAFLQNYPADKILSLGVVDGRNIWRCDLDGALDLLEPAKAMLKERLWIAPSCSLMHSPVDLEQEEALDEELKSWLAFAVQKLREVSTLKKGLLSGVQAIEAELISANKARASRANSPRIHNPLVKHRVQALSDDDARRSGEFSARQQAQRAQFKLPLFPTTTIGSFPQTAEIRQARALHKQGKISAGQYREQMQSEIQIAVRRQEQIGLDVLVHGEAERNDMVEYFGEQLAGFAFTQFGWVQSYGSRCVKPPIIFGDVSRPKPMTVEWSVYAQSLTQKPMKGMLTGPVTILQWSFVRDDQPRSQTAMQIALAIGDEVKDLEKAGINIIQIDEPAYREGLPLKHAQWDAYLDWASRAFRVAASGVADTTQIHTHMCYSEFNDILPAIAAMDADVITIETSRSDMELLEGFGKFKYPNEIGPGVYDIHSPRVPGTTEMVRLLQKARAVIPAQNLWINPDCGLKTRNWPEVEAALKNMVEAAQEMRALT